MHTSIIHGLNHPLETKLGTGKGEREVEGITISPNWEVQRGAEEHPL